MKGELVLVNGSEYKKDIFSVIPSYYDFGLSIYIDDENTLEKQLSKKDILISRIESYIDCLAEYESEDEETKIYDALKNNINNLLDNVEYVKLVLDDVNVIDFINNNPIIQNKKIVIPEFIKITDYNKVKELLTIYDKYKDNIYVKMTNNQGYVSLTECFNTINKIKEQANSILKLGLSVMETIMYTYDQVRNRVYNAENKGDLKSKSRDLSSVLSSDKIVCTGYSNIFSALLSYMGINCLSAELSHKHEAKESGHERNIIYVQDEKYDIDGVYYFDTTWDSKMETETNEFLNRYRFFAKTRKQMIEFENDSYIYDQCPYYSDDMVSDIKTVLDEGSLIDFYMKYAKSLNYMSTLVEGEKIITTDCIFTHLSDYKKLDKENILSRLSNIEDKFNKPISAETFIKLLNNVRKIEYYQNSELYPYTLNKLYETYIRSNWEFLKHHYNYYQKLLLSIFGSDENDLNTDRNDKKEDFINFTKNETINRNIKEVQLTKVLQKVYEKRNH